jgi:hypothetical protein
VLGLMLQEAASDKFEEDKEPVLKEETNTLR